jgi:DNA-directed RNA polymerase subunit K/omega
MNIELFKQALIKVKNPNFLVNVVSKRVRQLNSIGAASRPLVANITGLSATDVALREIVEDKLSFDAPLSTEALVGATPAGSGRKRRKS